MYATHTPLFTQFTMFGSNNLQMLTFVMKGNLIIARKFYLEGELIDALFQKNKHDILINIIRLTDNILFYR